MTSPLFEDIKAADLYITKAVDSRAEKPSLSVAAAERGLRTHPDGTTEDYERIEFVHGDG